jgi:hypothetical protein
LKYTRLIVILPTAMIAMAALATPERFEGLAQPFAKTATMEALVTCMTTLTIGGNAGI